MTNTTVGPNPNPPQDAGFSWTDVIWSLLPIAATMLQPSGKPCDAPAAIGPWMRISPIMCAIDTLITLIRLPMYVITKGSLRESVRIVFIQRYGYDDRVEGNFEDFRKNVYGRLLSALLSVPGIIKLFAVQDLVWTKVWAGMYLASYVVNEILALVAYYKYDWVPENLPPWCEDEDKPEFMPRWSGATTWPFISTAISTLFALYFLVAAFTATIKAHGRELAQYQCTGVVLLTFGAVPFVSSSAYSHIKRPDNKTVRKAWTLTAVIVVVPSLYFVSWIEHSSLNEQVQIVLNVMMLLVWVALCLWWASVTFKPIMARGMGRTAAKKIEYVLSRFFFCVNVVAAVLYYRYCYDGSNTHKPSWTDHLGS